MRDDGTALDVEALLAQSRYLRALARNLARHDQDAEDLVQEAYVAALEAPPRDPRVLPAWMTTVVRRLAGRKGREGDARRAREARVARPESVADESELRDQRVHLQRRLAEAILTLHEPYRSAVVLRWLEERSIEEVARVQGCTEDAVRQRLSRAMAQLRTRLDGEYGDRSWSVLALSWPAPGASSLAPLALSGGILNMSLSLKLVGAASLIVLAALFAWKLGRGHDVASVAQVSGPATELVSPSSGSGALEPPALPDSRAALATVAEAPPDEDTLRGLVLDGAGQPIEGADVEMTWRESSGYPDLLPLARAGGLARARVIANAHSDAQGRFAIRLAPGRAFDLRASAQGLAPALLLNRFAGEEVVVRLTRGAEIRGTVTRKQDGTPVVGARIRGFPRFESSELMSAPEDLFSATTDALGRYSISDLAPGAFVIECIPLEDALPGWGRAEVAANATVTCDFQVEPGFDVSGRVFDLATGAPLADAEVGIGWVMRRVVRSGADGRFVLRNFPAHGFREIGVRAAGYGHKTAAVMDNARGRITELEVGLGRSRSLVGRVLDDQQRPIAGAFVAAIASDRIGDVPQADFQSTHTAMDGTFLLEDVRPDLTHVLAVRAEGFGQVVWSLSDKALGEPRIECGDVVLTRGSLVRGLLVDPRGEPVPNRRIDLVWSGHEASPPLVGSEASGTRPTLVEARLAGSSVASYAGIRGARTDDRGRFAFADVAEGEYEVRCDSTDRRRPVTAPVRVRSSEQPELVKLVLEVGLPLSGQVVDANGAPLANMLVLLLASGPSMGSAGRTDAEGRFTLRDVPPGLCRLRVDPRGASRDGSLLAPVTSDALVAGQQNVSLRVPFGRRIRGMVVERDGSRARMPVVELRVAGAEDHPFYFSDRKTNGEFNFIVPVDASCTLRAVDGERATAEITILETTQDVRLELSPQ